MSLVVVARWRTTDKSQDRIAALLPKFAAIALATPGCLSFEAARSESDPRSFVLVEHYTDHAAFDLRCSATDYLRMLDDEFLPHLVLRERDTFVPLAETGRDPAGSYRR